MKKFVIRELYNRDIEKELQYIGFDEGYRLTASDKFKYKNLKIYDLTPEQANIIKQTALATGADCATHREVIRGNVEKSDVILGGSISELKKISKKLQQQPFGLKNLGIDIENQLDIKKHNCTKLAGILNVTPDSFSDGGKYIEPKDAQKQLIKLIQDGADIIDIGAESTRPYSKAVAPEEQIKRLKPILTFVQKENISIPISVDTRSSVTADFALNNGATIINDVSGFDYDKNMAHTVAKYNAGIILQHSKGTPEEMQNSPKYEDVVEEVFLCLKNKIEYAQSLGITKIISDVGIGFGKLKKDNLELVNRIEEFFSLNTPIMIGVSRKSLLGIMDDDNELKDSMTLAISTPMILKGIDYLRVHNVKLHRTFLNNLSEQ